MGLLSRFRSNDRRPAASSAAGKPPLLWRKGEFIAFAVGSESQVIYARNGTPVTLPSFAAEFAMSCHRFQSLEEHVSSHSEKHGWHSQQVQALGQWLPQLVEAGALISSEHVRTLCAARSEPTEATPRIELIGFPTGGPRASLLERSLRSFAANLTRHGRSAEFVVADSSADPAHRTLYREVVAGLSAALNVRISYSGEEERRAFCEALIAKGCQRQAVEFGLLDPFATGFACGANRNALLLQGAGQMLCSIDDDVVCRMVAPLETRSAPLALFSQCDPFARWPFASDEIAASSVAFRDDDFLAAHERLLGKDLSAVLHEGQELDVTSIDDELLRKLALGDGRVRTSFFGHFGDPGIPTSCYYLYYRGQNRRRLTDTETHFRAALTSRSMLALVPGPAIGDASISPGMAIGLDHRDLLPPFPPVLHAEDFVFGATVWQCCPRAFSGHVPLAVHHDPPAGKTVLAPHDLGPDCRVVLFEFAHLLRRVIFDFEPAQHSSTTDRMITLGRYLAEIAGMPLVDFSEVMREKTLSHESERLSYLDERLEDEEDAPEFWRTEVERFIENTQASLACPDFDIPHDLKPGRTADESRRFMQQLFAGYGALLQEWPAMVQAAREVQVAGIRPARELDPRR